MSVVLATAGYDHKIRFWEAPNGVCIRMIKFSDSQVNRLEITPDKQFIAAAGNPHARLYEIQANLTRDTKKNHRHFHHGQNSSSASASASSTNISGGDGSSRHMSANTAHDAQQQQEAVLTLEGHTGNVTSLGFQKDGRYLYTGSEDGTIKVWDLRNPHYCRSFDVGCAVHSVCLRTDRDEFISGDQNGYVKFWDLNSTKKGPIHSVKPSSPGGHFESKGQIDDTEAKYETSKNNPKGKVSSQRQQQQQQHRSYRYSEGIVPIQAVDVSEDSRTLVAVSNHGTVYVWDPSETGQGKTSTDTASDVPNTSARDATETTTSVTEVTTLTSAAPLRTVDAYGLRAVTKFRAHSEKPGTYCLHAKIAPDCRHLVTTASSGVAKLWDTTTWELTQTLIQQPNSNNSTSRGSSSTTGSNSGNASKWVWDAAFCADSSYLVTASSDHVARLWNLRTGDVVRQYHGHQSAVTCVALNDSSV